MKPKLRTYKVIKPYLIKPERQLSILFGSISGQTNSPYNPRIMTPTFFSLDYPLD